MCFQNYCTGLEQAKDGDRKEVWEMGICGEGGWSGEEGTEETLSYIFLPHLRRRKGRFQFVS